MDLKAGFHNIWVAASTVPLLGVITQDGLFVCRRMPFGLLGAPYWFQYVMDQLLGDLKQAASFVDDLTAKGVNW